MVAESVLVKQQLLILNRSRQRTQNLRASDRVVAGLCVLLVQPTRLIRSAIVLKPSTLLNLHQALRKRKYRLLFSPKRRCKPGPKGPSRELIDAIVATKVRNPFWGCPRTAQQVALAFNLSIDKDTVRRVLATHYRPKLDSGGPSWLTFQNALEEIKSSCFSMFEARTTWRLNPDFSPIDDATGLPGGGLRLKLRTGRHRDYQCGSCARMGAQRLQAAGGGRPSSRITADALVHQSPSSHF